MNAPRRWLAVYAAAFYAFLHLPLLTLAVFSFNSSRFTVWEHFSLDWYRAIFRDPQIMEGTWNSIVIAVLSTAIATLIGTACAYGLWKRGSPVLTGALYLSLVTPEIVTGISLLALFQWAFRWLHWQLGLYTVVLAHVAFSIAFVVIVISARLRTMPRPEEAAMDLGANPWQAFLYVTLPTLLLALSRPRCSRSPCRSTITSSPAWWPAWTRNSPHGDLRHGPARREPGAQRNFGPDYSGLRRAHPDFRKGGET
jgi:spermidine/putrescine transport system permease protein